MIVLSVLVIIGTMAMGVMFVVAGAKTLIQMWKDR